MEKDDGTLTKADEETAEELNKFFAFAFCNDDSDLLILNQATPHFFDKEVLDPFELTKKGQNIVKFRDITIQKGTVNKLLKDLNIYKAIGPAGIHPRFLRVVASDLQ